MWDRGGKTNWVNTHVRGLRNLSLELTCHRQQLCLHFVMSENLLKWVIKTNHELLLKLISAAKIYQSLFILIVWFSNNRWSIVQSVYKSFSSSLQWPLLNTEGQGICNINTGTLWFPSKREKKKKILIFDTVMHQQAYSQPYQQVNLFVLLK